MNNIKLKYSFATMFLFVVLLFLLSGCSEQKIELKRESLVSKLNKEMKQDKIKNSSGVVIYKTSNDAGNFNNDTIFGPKDINFDINFKLNY